MENQNQTTGNNSPIRNHIGMVLNVLQKGQNGNISRKEAEKNLSSLSGEMLCNFFYDCGTAKETADKIDSFIFDFIMYNSEPLECWKTTIWMLKELRDMFLNLETETVNYINNSNNTTNQ